VPAPVSARASTPLARATPIFTATPSDNADPVSFVTDPNGNPFGYGVVARGGTAMQATRPVASVPARPAAPPPEISTAHSDWTRAPRLDESDPCSGFFPRNAVADVGRVALVVVIDPGGRVTSTAIADESPPGDGFGQAARACLATKILTPALDRDGRPTHATATVRIRFSR
jgi:protein TonB